MKKIIIKERASRFTKEIAQKSREVTVRIVFKQQQQQVHQNMTRKIYETTQYYIIKAVISLNSNHNKRKQ